MACGGAHAQAVGLSAEHGAIPGGQQVWGIGGSDCHGMRWRACPGGWPDGKGFSERRRRESTLCGGVHGRVL
eukprot:350033-Chlamydomonas_euryale.AAC.9